MKRNAGPLFVERKKYRRRRLMDAARILPVAGFVLLMLPMLWARGDGTGIAGEALYLFLVWAALIAGAALIARPLGRGTVAEASRPVPAAEAPPWAAEAPVTSAAGSGNPGDSANAGPGDSPADSPGDGAPQPGPAGSGGAGSGGGSSSGGAAP